MCIMYMHQCFHCLQWYTGSERVKRVWWWDIYNLLTELKEFAQNLLGTRQQLKTIAMLVSANISGTIVPLTTQIKLLGVTLSFDSHITALSKSCFYHICALRHILPILSEGTANLIASVLVSSRLDYANACLFGISNKNLSRIQRI